MRLICESCAGGYTLLANEHEWLSRELGSKMASQRYLKGKGCSHCNGTGYLGRTAICELLDLTDSIREMILEKRPTSEIRRAAREEGMRFLRESALAKVKSGITTLKEINKVTFIETMR